MSSSIVCTNIEQLTISLGVLKSILSPQLFNSDIISLYYGTQCEFNRIVWFGGPPKLINPRINNEIQEKLFKNLHSLIIFDITKRIVIYTESKYVSHLRSLTQQHILILESYHLRKNSY